MNAVELKSHGWKLVLSATVAITSGLLIISVVLDLPTVPISAAFGDVVPSQPLEQVDCASLAPDGHSWHAVDIDPDGDAAIDVRVGSAALTVEPGAASKTTATETAGSKIRWHSEMGIDAVVVRTSTGSHVHRFDAERFDGAHDGFADKEVAGLTFCYDLEVTVNADANTSLTRTYEWSIDQTVDPAHWQLRPNTSGVSTYEISVNRDAGTEGDWDVRGTITIDNLTPSNVELESVDNLIDGGLASRVDCGVEVGGYVLESGASLACEYYSRLPDASPRTATARVRTNGRVLGASTTARIDFNDAAVHEIDQSAYVTSNQGRSWAFHHSGSATYQRTFHCEDDVGLHPSAVRIEGSEKRSSTSVSVDCRTTAPTPQIAQPKPR
jgi:hypothetical protein